MDDRELNELVERLDPTRAQVCVLERERLEELFGEIVATLRIRHAPMGFLDLEARRRGSGVGEYWRRSRLRRS